MKGASYDCKRTSHAIHSRPPVAWTAVEGSDSPFLALQSGARWIGHCGLLGAGSNFRASPHSLRSGARSRLGGGESGAIGGASVGHRRPGTRPLVSPALRRANHPGIGSFVGAVLTSRRLYAGTDGRLPGRDHRRSGDAHSRRHDGLSHHPALSHHHCRRGSIAHQRGHCYHHRRRAWHRPPGAQPGHGHPHPRLHRRC